MRVIIAGSRSATRLDYLLLERALKIVQKKHKWVISEVVCGEAKGADALGKKWAIAHSIPVESFWPDWGDPDDPDTEAGHRRNEEMACYAAEPIKVLGKRSQGALLALWDGHSSGTRDMIARAKAHGLVLYIAYMGGRIAKSY